MNPPPQSGPNSIYIDFGNVLSRYGSWFYPYGPLNKNITSLNRQPVNLKHDIGNICSQILRCPPSDGEDSELEIIGGDEK